MLYVRTMFLGTNNPLLPRICLFSYRCLLKNLFPEGPGPGSHGLCGLGFSLYDGEFSYLPPPDPEEHDASYLTPFSYLWISCLFLHFVLSCFAFV